MNIKTDMKLTEGKNPVKAFAEVILDNSVVIHRVRIIDKGRGPYVSLPFFKMSDGKELIRKSIIGYTCDEAKHEVVSAVLAAYEYVKSQTEGGETNG